MIGFGTGCLYKLVDAASKQAVDLIRSSGVRAIELCGELEERFSLTRKDSFMNLTKRDLEEFDYVSLHAPSQFCYSQDENTFNLLDRIDKIHKTLGLRLVVFTPQSFNDFSVLSRYYFPIAFENMDFRKGNWRNTAELAKLFENPRFKWVFDATHAYTCDKTMKTAREMLERYGDRLVEVHCSGYYVHGEDEQQHFPASLEEQSYERTSDLPHQAILSAVPKHVPIIIESVFPKGTAQIEEGLNREYKTISEFLER
jgi:sugar phosphate isomerase/epimerase